MNKSNTVHKKYFPIVLILLIIFHACKPVREVMTPTPVPFDPAISRTLQSLKAGEASFDYFSTRFSGNANIDNSNYSVSGSIRIKKDTAIYISVAPVLGIELARLLVTPDSVRFMNRLEGTYFEGDMDFLNTMFNTNLDFYMLQSILVGNDFSHFNTEGFSLGNDRDRILLQNENRRPMGQVHGMSFQQNIWLDSESYRIRENLLYDPLASQSLRVTYRRHDLFGGQQIPQEMTLVFTEPGARAEFSVRYNRITINQPQSMEFSVPQGYRSLNN